MESNADPVVVEMQNIPAQAKPTARPKSGGVTDIDEHLMTLAEVTQRYHVQIDEADPAKSGGLTSTHAAERLAADGPNAMTPPEETPAWKKFLHHITQTFNLLLIISGIACEVLYGIDSSVTVNLYLGIILIVVAFINAIIEFVQEAKSASIMKSFLGMIPQNTWVIRDTKLQQIAAQDIVKGDVVWIRFGEKCPADLRIFKASDLKVDNASLTGESEPQERRPGNDHTNALEATNLAFNGSLIVNGEGYGLVVRTGDQTVLGQIAGLTAGEKKRPSPLAEEIDNFVAFISTIAVITAIIFFLVAGISVGIPWISAVSFAIGIFVSWVPEGLPATVTILLTIASKRMAKQQVLVKDLKGVETLGAITILATDKTGTLTRNQMTVTNIWSNLQMYSSENKINALNPGTPFDQSKFYLDDVLHISYLCSKAKFVSTTMEIGQRSILGDATESGLLRFSANKIPDSDDLHDKYPKVFEIPFNSDNKWMMTIHKKPHANGPLTLYIKGAPERVLKLCSKIISNDMPSIPLTDSHKRDFNKAYEYMAGQGHRVIAMACIALPGDQYPENFEFTKDPVNYPVKDLTLVGLISLEDPPKHGVREAIGQCRQAGIQVMMVTGDHPLTAEAIGRKINLMLLDTKEMVAKKNGRPLDSIQDSEYGAVVVHGDKIDDLTEAQWETILSKEEIIFARTSPKHKLEIVKRAQARGHVVGVTGDGVNDSPALKKADLGIAMNISGSDVSKEAASMVLLDDNFASTVHGIEQGRLIFQNLKKSVQYTITHTMPEVMANLLYVVVPLPLPLSAILIIFVDLGFEMGIALSYAWEVPESKTGLMKVLPRKPVNAASIQALRIRNELESHLSGHSDPYSDDNSSNSVSVPSNWFQQKATAWRHTFTNIFTKDWWKLKFTKAPGETLVDANVLISAYLEFGIIESIGCMTCYFFAMWYQWGITLPMQKQYALSGFVLGAPDIRVNNGTMLDADGQLHALATGQSAYFFTLLILQTFNHFICKCRYRLPFGSMLFKNTKTYIGLAIAYFVGVFWVYPHFMYIPFGTWTVSPMVWLVAFAFGLFMLAYATVRILLFRRFDPPKMGTNLPLNLQQTILTVDLQK